MLFVRTLKLPVCHFRCKKNKQTYELIITIITWSSLFYHLCFLWYLTWKKRIRLCIVRSSNSGYKENAMSKMSMRKQWGKHKPACLQYHGSTDAPKKQSEFWYWVLSLDFFRLWKDEWWAGNEQWDEIKYALLPLCCQTLITFFETFAEVKYWFFLFFFSKRA